MEILRQYRDSALADGLAWPDYSRARAESGFTSRASGSLSSLQGLTGYGIGDVLRDTNVIIDACRRGRKLHTDLFGPDVSLPRVSTAPISYGHANVLGCPLIFPEDPNGDVGVEHAFQNVSLEETIEAVRQADPSTWPDTGEMPFYLEQHRQLTEAFPGENVTFSFVKEGPITTAWILRGEQFFLDLMDHPGRTAELLEAVTDSIVDYDRLVRGIFGTPGLPDPYGAGMADDIASMVPASLFESHVLPFWDRYYRGLTTGRRVAHVEDLRPNQLPALESIGLCRFDPSVSPKLKPAVIHETIRVPFDWRLVSFHYPALNEQAVREWVWQAAAAGASGVITITDSTMCNDETAEKVRAFVEAARRAEEHIAAGKDRAELLSWCTENRGP